MGRNKPAKPETKSQRANRKDSTYSCPLTSCGASFADAATLGVHIAAAHPAQTPGIG